MAQRDVATESIPSHCSDSHGDPTHILKSWIKHSISFLAMQAAHGALTSGSTSVKYWVPECKLGPDSDIDIYIPATANAIEDAVHVMNASGIRWNNHLDSRLKEFDVYGMTVIPHKTIYNTAYALKAHKYETKFLETYLLKTLPKGPGLAGVKGRKRKAKSFVEKFCAACETCLREKFPEPEDTIWVFDNSDYRSIKLPNNFEEVTKHIINILDRKEAEQIDPSKDEDEEGEEQIDSSEDEDEEGEEQRESNILKSWLEKNLHIDLLRKYLKYRVILERRYYGLVSIYRVIDDLLGLEDMKLDATIDATRPTTTYSPTFRILRGTLPSGKEVQLIIVPKNDGDALKTVLHFYATHVMSFIGGTLGAHFYYNTAKEKKSIEFDFQHDPRQKLAEVAIGKWKDRGWEFRKAAGHDSGARNGHDQDAKMEDFENVYLQAIEKVGKSRRELPKWWDDYFTEKKILFRSLSWRVYRGRVEEVRYDSHGIYYDWKFLEWIHEELDGHPGVMKKKEWQERHETQHFRSIQLDIWFSGVRILGREAAPEHDDRLPWLYYKREDATVG